MADDQTQGEDDCETAHDARCLDDLPSFPSISQKLVLGSNVLAAAEAGLRRAQETLLELRVQLHSAGRPMLPFPVFDLDAAQQRLRDAAACGVSDGLNLLRIDERDELTVVIGSALTRSPEGGLALRPLAIDRTRTALFDAARAAPDRRGLLDRTASRSNVALAALDAARLSRGDGAYLADVLHHLDAMLSGLRAAFSHLSIARSRLGLQSGFIASLLADHPVAGVSEVLERAALRRTALQTKRLLSEQSRSIASLNRDTVLALFRDG